MARRIWSLLPALLLSTALGGAASVADPTTDEQQQPLSRLINQNMYKAAISNIFGGDIKVSIRFEPENREDGLLAIGAGLGNISADGIELYDTLARGIAEQVVEPQRRRTLFRCEPKNPKASDAKCAQTFLNSTGRLLFRRPLKDEELATEVRVAGEVADKEHDFYAGISAVLSKMLISPEFLYLKKTIIPDPAHPRQLRLDSYSTAMALSTYLWGTPPDDILLQAAEKGELLTNDGLRRQVDRMMSSTSIEGGVRAFFSDMLGFDEFETLSKDTQFFPEFTPKVIDQAREQTLRTIVNHVVAQGKDYRDLFTTPNTMLTRQLAAIYGVPIADKADNGQPDRWVPYTYPAGDPRAGVLSQISFVALHSPAGRTSPTLRGKALREYFMCQPVPPPPGNVDFKFVQDTANPVYKTTRDRLTAHRSEAMCAGCHKITDPLGLSLENFDSAGDFRETENGVKIDTSGELNGIKFDGPAGLAKVVHDDPAITSCVVKRSFAYAAGHNASPKDDAVLQKQFKDSGYNVMTLMRQIAMNPLTYSVTTGTPESK